MFKPGQSLDTVCYGMDARAVCYGGIPGIYGDVAERGITGKKCFQSMISTYGCFCWRFGDGYVVFKSAIRSGSETRVWDLL